MQTVYFLEGQSWPRGHYLPTIALEDKRITLLD